MTQAPTKQLAAPVRPTDTVSIVDALEVSVQATVDTFSRQMGIDLEIEGEPCKPELDDVRFGSTIALTSDSMNFQFAYLFSADDAEDLTRNMFALDEDSPPSLADMADALSEIPNVAAGLWKALRKGMPGENYLLGLPIFLRGAHWVHCFPDHVNVLAQKLTGPGGLSLQVLLVRSQGTNAGASETMPSQTVEKKDYSANSVPAQVLKEAVKAVVDTCSIQMDLPLTVVDHPTDPRDTSVEFGSSIALTAEGGGWQLAVMANKPGCHELTRSLFAMEPDENPEYEDMADALGEIANVAAGVLKSSRAEAGQKVQLGLPLFLEGKSCVEFFANGLQGMAQTVRGPNDLEAHVIIIWQER